MIGELAGLHFVGFDRYRFLCIMHLCFGYMVFTGDDVQAILKKSTVCQYALSPHVDLAAALCSDRRSGR